MVSLVFGSHTPRANALGVNSLNKWWKKLYATATHHVISYARRIIETVKIDRLNISTQIS